MNIARQEDASIVFSVPRLFYSTSFFTTKHCVAVNHLPFLSSTAKATFDAISKTYSYLTPDLWKETVFTKSPYQVGEPKF